MYEVTKEQTQSIFDACEIVWRGIARDIPVTEVSTEDMIVLATDGGRLQLYGYETEGELFTKLCNELGYTNASKELAKYSKYSSWEAGGAQ